MMANTPSNAATAANEPTVLAEPQPACWAETTVYTSSSIAAVTVSAPGRSNLRPVRAARSPRGMSQIAATSTTSATGAGHK